eukprot:Clim_evm24s6 gene=Clim_evmTU24s6
MTTNPGQAADAALWNYPASENVPWIAHKFGGTSMKGCAGISSVAEIIVNGDQYFNGRTVAVVSAMAGVTNALYAACDAAEAHDNAYVKILDDVLDMHEQTLLELSETTTLEGPWLELYNTFTAEIESVKDVLRAGYLTLHSPMFHRNLVYGHGELWSSRMLVAKLRSMGKKAEFCDARDVLRVVALSEKAAPVAPPVSWDTSSQRWKDYLSRLKATDDAEASAPMRLTGGLVSQSKMDRDQVKETQWPIIIATGFIASDEHGKPTTLGRNGSDYSGAIFAALVDARLLTIWTDVDGVYSADPRKVPGAHLISELSYEEAVDMSFYGAKIIHPKTMAPAVRTKIPIWIRNTFNIVCPGTRISHADSILTTRNVVKRTSGSTRESFNLDQVQGALGSTDDILGHQHARELIAAQLDSSLTGMGNARANGRPNITRDVSLVNMEEAMKRVEYEAELNSNRVIKAVASIENVALVNITFMPSLLGEEEEYLPLATSNRILAKLQDVNVNVLMTAQAAQDRLLTLCVGEESGVVTQKAVREELARHESHYGGAAVEYLTGYAIVTAVGDDINKTAGVAARFFEALRMANINSLGIAQNGERIISVLMKKSDAQGAVSAIHTAFKVPRNIVRLGIFGGRHYLMEFLHILQVNRHFRKIVGGRDIVIAGMTDGETMWTAKETRASSTSRSSGTNFLDSPRISTSTLFEEYLAENYEERPYQAEDFTEHVCDAFRAHAFGLVDSGTVTIPGRSDRLYRTWADDYGALICSVSPVILRLYASGCKGIRRANIENALGGRNILGLLDQLLVDDIHVTELAICLGDHFLTDLKRWADECNSCARCARAAQVEGNGRGRKKSFQAGNDDSDASTDSVYDAGCNCLKQAFHLLFTFHRATRQAVFLAKWAGITNKRDREINRRYPGHSNLWLQCLEACHYDAHSLRTMLHTDPEFAGAIDAIDLSSVNVGIRFHVKSATVMEISTTNVTTTQSDRGPSSIIETGTASLVRDEVQYFFRDFSDSDNAPTGSLTIPMDMNINHSSKGMISGTALILANLIRDQVPASGFL